MEVGQWTIWFSFDSANVGFDSRLIKLVPESPSQSTVFEQICGICSPLSSRRAGNNGLVSGKEMVVNPRMGGASRKKVKPDKKHPIGTCVERRKCLSEFRSFHFRYHRVTPSERGHNPPQGPKGYETRIQFTVCVCFAAKFSASIDLRKLNFHMQIRVQMSQDLLPAFNNRELVTVRNT